MKDYKKSPLNNSSSQHVLYNYTNSSPIKNISPKTKDILNIANTLLSNNKIDSKKLTSLRKYKIELKQGISEREDSIKGKIEKTISRMSNNMFFKIAFGFFLKNGTKLERMQNEYQLISGAYHQILEHSPSVAKAKKVQLLIKQANKELIASKGDWSKVDEAFSKEFKELKLLGDIHTLLGPKDQGKREAIDEFLNNLVDGLEQIRLSNALKSKQLTWLHGTRSPALAVMLNTQKELIPTGQLLNRNIYPLTGELLEGISEGGVNQTKLSGTAMSKLGAKTTLEYSKDFVSQQINEWNFLSRISQTVDYAEYVLGDDPKLEGKFAVNFKLDFIRLGIFIERLKVTDPEFETKIVSFRDQLDTLIMAKIGNAPDALIDRLLDLRFRCDTPPFIQPNQMVLDCINNSFPIILASASAKGKPQKGTGFLDEHTVKGTLHLSNIAIAFTEPEHVDRLKKYISDAGLNIEVLDFNALKALGMFAPDYLHPEAPLFPETE